MSSKGLILGKNKPWTEIQTPTRKVYFYRFVTPSTHPLNVGMDSGAAKA